MHEHAHIYWGVAGKLGRYDVGKHLSRHNLSRQSSHVHVGDCPPPPPPSMIVCHLCFFKSFYPEVLEAVLRHNKLAASSTYGWKGQRVETILKTWNSYGPIRNGHILIVRERALLSDCTVNSTVMSSVYYYDVIVYAYLELLCSLFSQQLWVSCKRYRCVFPTGYGPSTLPLRY